MAGKKTLKDGTKMPVRRCAYTSPVAPKPHGSLFDRMASKFEVDLETGCWLWTASRDSKGYAQIGRGGRGAGIVRAHRAMYEALRGPCPVGLVADHKCRVRHCINPDHLEFVTNRENILRGTGFAARHAVKTHCPKGHEYTPENTSMYKTERRCRECHRIVDRERYARKKAAHAVHA